MSRPDEGLIHAWLDGELEPAEASRVERLVAEDAEWAAAAAEARGFMAASGRILSALDHVPGDVMPAGSARTPARRPLASRPWVRIAAGIVLVAGVGLAVVSGESSAPLATPMIARDAEPAIAPVDQPTVAAPSPARVAAPRSAGVVAAPRAEPQSRERAAADVAAPPPEVEAVPTAVQPVAPTAAPPAVSRAPAEVEERATASRLSRREAAAAGAQAFSAAAKALSVQTLEGCWRVHTAAGADSVLSTPRVLRSVGDTLVIDAGPASRPARVARLGTDTLRGEMADAAGRAVPFSAVRTECAAPATPSPRR